MFNYRKAMIRMAKEDRKRWRAHTELMRKNGWHCTLLDCCTDYKNTRKIFTKAGLLKRG